MLKNSAIFQNNNDWNNFVKSELSKEYFKKLIDFLSREYNEKTIFPSLESVFSALEITSF
jgi:uracil-DNA glycosylase